MRRRILVGLAVVVCGAVAFTATSFASGAAQSKTTWKTKTIELYGVQTSFTFVDTDGSGPLTAPEDLTAGDLFITTIDYYDRPGGKKLAHTEGGTCMWLGNSFMSCTDSLVFPDGRVFIQGVHTPESLTGTARAEFAVTGGTGAYRNVRGEMLEHFDSVTGTETDTLTLIGVAG